MSEVEKYLSIYHLYIKIYLISTTFSPTYLLYNSSVKYKYMTKYRNGRKLKIYVLLKRKHIWNELHKFINYNCIVYEYIKF